MGDSEGKQAGKRLDSLLRDAPDRMLEILREGDFSRTLEQLREAGTPDPAWVRAKARNIRLKCGCADAELRDLAQSLEGALSAWQSQGGADALRQAQAELMLWQIRQKSGELKTLREGMKTLIGLTLSAEEEARQAELLTALNQLRSYGKEGAE